MIVSKREGTAKQSNGKWFVYNKTGYLIKDFKNRSSKEPE